MKNNFRVFLCVLFAVILPFVFVGCGKKNAGDNSGSGGETPNSGNSSPESPEQSISYVLDETEAVKILGESATYLDNFVENLNDKSNIIETNDYLTAVGNLTASAINYLNYPSRLINGLVSQLETKSRAFKFGEIYAYKPATGIYRYIEVTTNGNSEIIVSIVSKDTTEYVYFKFILKVNEGDIESIKLSRLETPSSAKKIEFMDVLFDSKNMLFEASFGNLVNYSSSSDKFFTDNFTKEKFDDILGSCWSYSCYEKLPILENNNFECEYKSMDNVLVNQFDKFGFLDAFTEYAERMNLSNDQLVGVNADLIQIIDPTINVYSYVSDEYLFEKNV